MERFSQSYEQLRKIIQIFVFRCDKQPAFGSQKYI